MSDTASAEPFVRRKLRTGGSKAGPMDDRVARVWRQVAARALKASIGLNAQVTELSATTVPPDDLADMVQPGDLTALMENHVGDVGLALVDPDLITALIEMQTIGKVTDRQAPPRDPTPVDGALVGPTLDRVLAGAANALAENGLRDPVTDYRFAMLSEAGAPPTLALADLLHACITIELKIEGGKRTGTLRLVVPDTGASAEQKAAGKTDWQMKIGSAVLSSDVTIEARLGRVKMPIEDVTRLSEGDMLPLPVEDLHRIRLVVAQGDLAARGKLGQANGFRAVKILPEDDEEGDPVWSEDGLDLA